MVKLIAESVARDRVGAVLVPHEDRSVGGEIGKSIARRARAGEYLSGVQGDRIPALVHDQVQRRVNFEGVDNIASQRHHVPKGIEEVENIAQASRRRSEAPQTNDRQSVEGVGRRARAILEQ